MPFQCGFKFHIARLVKIDRPGCSPVHYILVIFVTFVITLTATKNITPFPWLKVHGSTRAPFSAHPPALSEPGPVPKPVTPTQTPVPAQSGYNAQPGRPDWAFSGADRTPHPALLP